MNILVMFAVLTALTGGICVLSRRKFEECLALSVFTIVGILYVSGLCGSLLPGFYICLALIAAAFIYCIVTLFRDRRRLLTNLLTPGFLFFLCFLVFIFIAHYGRLFIWYDEFSHWGTVVKKMTFLDKLGTAPEVFILFEDYPSGTGLFHYFWMKINGGFSEGIAYRSMNLFILALLLPYLKVAKTKTQSLLTCLILFLLPMMFVSEIYQSMYVDGILGLATAYILFTYFTEGYTRFGLLSISMGLFVLTLMKSSGFALALLCVIVIAVDLVINRKAAKAFIISKKIQNSVLLALPLIGTLAAKISWKIQMQINGVTGSWDWPLSEYLTAFKNILTGQGEAYQYTSYRNFFANVVTMRYPTGHFFNLTFASAWLISLFLLIGLVWYSKSRLEKRRYKGMFITLTVFVAAYLFYLLTLYLCLMSEPEALRSASFERYSATIAIAILFTGLFLVLYRLSDHPTTEGRMPLAQKGMLVCLAFLLVNMSLLPIVNLTVNAPLTAAESRAGRQEYAGLVRASETLDYRTDRMQFVYYGEDRIWDIKAPFVTCPVFTERAAPTGDVASWQDHLERERITHVYLGVLDDMFAETYADIFENPDQIKEESLFKVEMVDGDIRLVAAE